MNPTTPQQKNSRRRTQLNNEPTPKGETQTIPYTELLQKALNQKTLQHTKHGLFTNGVHLLKLTYPKQDNPSNQQNIWLLYHPKNPEPIDAILNDLYNVSKATDGKTVIIDIDHPDYWALEIICLSEGCMTGNRVSIKYPSTQEAHIGWIIGQGRTLAVENNPQIRWIIHILVSTILTGTLPRDPFIQNGAKKLAYLNQTLRKHRP